MVKIFLASHGNLADGMLSSIKIIFGEPSNLSVFSAYVNDGNLEDKLNEFFAKASSEDELLLCSDIYGGSVNQIMYRYIGTQGARLVTGVNLGFMLEILNCNTLKDGTLEKVIESSKKYLCEVCSDGQVVENESDSFFD